MFIERLLITLIHNVNGAQIELFGHPERKRTPAHPHGGSAHIVMNAMAFEKRELLWM